jgi:hypothetical protein|tara:strand:+ start:229 stop:414 length:186 start_codon:yes stop_codon:yes gene_type:complete
MEIKPKNTKKAVASINVVKKTPEEIAGSNFSLLNIIGIAAPSKQDTKIDIKIDIKIDNDKI